MLDTLLDRTVIGGYTRVGYALRKRHWDDAELPSMAGKRVIVTGATSGLGFAAAAGFARQGARVLLLARSSERGERARQELSAQTGSEELELAICDLSELASIRRFVTEFCEREERLDVLVHNAGVLSRERRLSADGIELTFATNVVGPFLATKLLVPRLRASQGRVTNVSSGGMYAQRIDVEDLQSGVGEYRGTVAYARSKRAQVILTGMAARRLAGTGVVVHAMHPGWVDTPGLREGLARFYTVARPVLRTPAQGADTIVWLGCAPEAATSSGDFWHDRARRPTNLAPWTRESAAERERLWEECERLSDAGS